MGNGAAVMVGNKISDLRRKIRKFLTYLMSCEKSCEEVIKRSRIELVAAKERIVESLEK